MCFSFVGIHLRRRCRRQIGKNCGIWQKFCRRKGKNLTNTYLGFASSILNVNVSYAERSRSKKRQAKYSKASICDTKTHTGRLLKSLRQFQVQIVFHGLPFSTFIFYRVYPYGFKNFTGTLPYVKERLINLQNHLQVNEKPQQCREIEIY